MHLPHPYTGAPEVSTPTNQHYTLLLTDSEFIKTLRHVINYNNYYGNYTPFMDLQFFYKKKDEEGW